MSNDKQETKGTGTLPEKPSERTILQDRIPTPYELRAELEELVARDLLGPAGGPDEEVDEFRVHDRYLVGILAPQDGTTPAEELDSQGTSESGIEEHGDVDSDASQTTSLSPSSMGMSFCVDRNATRLKITARWGHYIRVSRVRDNEMKGSGRIWHRIPRGNTPIILDLKAGPIERLTPEPEEQPDVYVKGLIRQSQDFWTITLFLVNGQHIRTKRNWDAFYLFQPELIVESPDGAPIFRRRPTELQRLYKNEDQMLAMLYRRHVGFAIGHGVSIHAETLDHDSSSAIRLSTSFIPCYEIPRTDAPTAKDIPQFAELCLDMEKLAYAERAELPTLLNPLTEAYATWIDEQERRIDDPMQELQHYQQIARRTIDNCRTTLRRIQSGIKLLSSNEQAAQAFRFMNRAMWLQRIHTILAEEVRNGGSRTLPEISSHASNHSWRPFQLAFILLSLPSLTDPTHPERSVRSEALAELLWFPTGGGKTEAYLGLTAYTFGIRRLQGTIAGRSGEDGIAVIMRYTLRLLTLQQFQRAAALICACEIIRAGDPRTWGQTPFRLGLWVGQRSTPNTTEESDKAIDQARSNSNYSSGTGSPRQITHCPWCGLPIAAGQDITVESFKTGRGRTLIYCSDHTGQCPFCYARAPHEGIPVIVVDEEIYRQLPALLIATVDKFAQLPWKGETQMLFGQVDKYCERHGFRSPDLPDSDRHKKTAQLPAAQSHDHIPLRPPDLIIQDELHLISGPLGTLVGLYETAVDQLATWEIDGQQVRPKVIAATATIRQADHQMKALFMRNVEIFPPQGLDIEDNFFSQQRQPGPETPGRRYLGICANGRRMKATQIRVYLALLAGAQTLYNRYGAAVDPWMTLVGYFNSISQLGSMRHLVDDDISNRIWRMEQRGLANRHQPKLVELTSRTSSADIPAILNNLEQSFSNEQPVEKRSAEKKTTQRPIDILLATNMISVGVDVKRLGLMVVTGQPKTTSEYIQATSRVGRNAPGLVYVVYNWARPRDISHYEQFEHYHATFYQYVEALSVTPFAPRAMDRGLAALLVSLIRLSGMRFSRNDSAGQLDSDPAQLDQAIELICQRANEIAPESSEIVRKDLLELKDYWLAQASHLPHLNYKRRRDGEQSLLKEPQRGKWEPFTCLNSLRNVEPAVQLMIDERDLGKPDDPASAVDIQEEAH